MIVTKEEFDELSSMVEEIHKYIFSERFTPRRGEVRMTSTELKDILNIPHNTYYEWLRKGCNVACGSQLQCNMFQ